MSRIVSFQVYKWDYSRWQKRFSSHFKQDNVKQAIAKVYLEMTEKYVPYKTGALTKSGRVLKDGTIRWGFDIKKPNYAIFPYEGVGRGGSIMHYTRTVHPLARSHWDLAVYNLERNAFKWRVTHKLKEIAEEEGW